MGGDPVNYYDPDGLFQHRPDEPDISPPIRQTNPPRRTLTVEDWDDIHPDPKVIRWRKLSTRCRNGLTDALKVKSNATERTAAHLRLAALDRALAEKQTLQDAVAGTDIGWAMIAAIGIRETGFRNVSQSDGDGRGVFQIDLGKNPSITEEQASDIAWAASWAAGTLSSNYSRLQKNHPSMNVAQLLHATAASWNLGVGGISGNPDTIDQGSTGNNYGSNIMNLMDCFK